MRIPGFLKVPFAFSGDKTAIPEALQPGGQVSMTQGWGPDYQKDLASDPTAKAIDRQQTNQLFNVVSTLLQRWQSETFPEFIDAAANGGAAYPYSVGTIVRVPNGASWVLRISTHDANTAIPNVAAGTADWADATSALLNAVLLNNPDMQVMSGALTVGAGSLIGGATPAQTVTDKRMASMEWVTTGKSTIRGASDGRPLPGAINKVTFPKWLSSDGLYNYTKWWGIARLPYLGTSGGLHIYGVIDIPITNTPIPVELVSMNASHNHDTAGAIPELGITVRMPDFMTLQIAATSSLNLGTSIACSWTVDAWRP